MQGIEFLQDPPLCEISYQKGGRGVEWLWYKKAIIRSNQPRITRLFFSFLTAIFINRNSCCFNQRYKPFLF